MREALATLPFYFRTETVIAGINATDIFNLNAVRVEAHPDDEHAARLAALADAVRGLLP